VALIYYTSSPSIHYPLSLHDALPIFTTIRDPKELQRCIYEVAATWIALGLDTEKAIFYKQSEIPEIFELTWLLSCVTPKGLMNRSEEHTSELQSRFDLVCRLLLEKKK